MTTEPTTPPTPSPETETPTPSAATEPPRPASRRLHRSRTNRVFAGLCGGVAEYYGSSPTAIRLLTLVIGLFTGIVPMVVLYIIGAVVVPENDGELRDSTDSRLRSGQTALILGAFLVVAGIAGLVNVWFRVEWEQVWPVGLIVLGVVIVMAATLRRSVNGSA